MLSLPHNHFSPLYQRMYIFWTHQFLQKMWLWVIMYSHLTTGQGLMSMYIMYLWHVKGSSKWLYIRDSSPMNIGSSALVRSLSLTRPVLLHSNMLQVPRRPFCPNLDLYSLTLFFTWSAEGNIHKSLHLCFAQILTDYLHWTPLCRNFIACTV